MFSKILICLDDSDVSEQIVPYAAELARRFGSRLVLFTAVDTVSAATPEYAVEMDMVQELKRSQAQRHLEQVAARLAETGLAAEPVVTVGSPAHAIVDYAATNGVELIAMGTHGRKNIGRLVFGSVMDHVLRHAGVPVLAMRPQPEAT